MAALLADAQIPQRDLVADPLRRQRRATGRTVNGSRNGAKVGERRPHAQRWRADRVTVGRASSGTRVSTA